MFEVILKVDKGFVAQVADVASGRSAPMNEEQRKEAEKTIVGEFSDVKHVRGILSMGRYVMQLVCVYECSLFVVCSYLYDDDVCFSMVFLFCRYEDPNSAQSSFSMLLGDAPHLDRQVSSNHLSSLSR